MDFGAFVEIAPGKEGLVHISQLDIKRTENVTDVVNVGDIVKVKVLEIDDKGRLNLSRREALIDLDGAVPENVLPEKQPRRERSDRPRGDRPRPRQKRQTLSSITGDKPRLVPFCFLNQKGMINMKTKLVLLGTGTPNACPWASGPGFRRRCRRPCVPRRFRTRRRKTRSGSVPPRRRCP